MDNIDFNNKYTNDSSIMPENKNNNKKLIVFIVAVALVVAGIGGYFVLKKLAPTAAPGPKPPTGEVGRCGDNVCDRFERTNPSACPKDCMPAESSQPSQPTSSEQSSALEKSKNQINKDSPFGGLMFFSLDKSLRSKGPPPKPDQFDFKPTKDLGIKWGRAHYLTWSMVQPTKDAIDKKIYDWSDSDSVLSSYPEGFNVLENIVAFSAKVDDTGEHLENFSFSSKNDEDSYARFIEKAIERYDGDGKDDMPGLKNPIKYWQVDNEPDAKTKDWKGYANTLKITYLAVKKVCPDCKVVAGGMALGPNGLTSFFKPALEELNGKYFDIFDYHFYGNKDEWLKNGEQAEEIRKTFPNYDFEIWLTEMGTWSGKPSFPPSQTAFQSEKEQAEAVIKYYVKPLSVGVKKVFWAWGILEGFGGLENNVFDNTGLIYDGDGPNDLGFGVKKLGYYTYKKMVEVLEGSDWNNIQTIQEQSGVYVYKFIKNGKPIWVAWNDNSAEKQVTISGVNSSSVKITEAVPNYETGKEVKNYDTAFKTETKNIINNKLTIILGETPVFAEGE